MKIFNVPSILRYPIISHPIFVLLTFVLASPSFAQSPPENSWEHWMTAMMEGGKKGLPGRPDGKRINEELPVWVDCFLSHFVDQPQTKKNSLLRKLVLKAHPKLCIGSLTEWAE